MHGLGNDFLILDGRENPFTPNTSSLVALADRKRGIGYDQLLIMLKPRSPGTDVYLDMYNSDGSPFRASGNGMRCMAQFLFKELGRKNCVIETVADKITCYEDDTGMIAVDMGIPRLEWNQIPLAKEIDTLHVPIKQGNISDACCVNVGNPHATFFVPDISKVPLDEIGFKFENDPVFPDRANIEFAQVLRPDCIRMRVWERGAGPTGAACGSGACATLISAVRRGLSARRAKIIMDGGEAIVEWRENDGHVILIGPAAMVYRGEMDDEFLALVQA